MELSSILSQSKSIIDKHSVELIKQYKGTLSSSGDFGIKVFDELASKISQGKSIRGSLLLFSAKAFGVKNLDSAADCAVALELIQLGLLIHDDIMDQDDLRRGKVTLHKSFQLFSKEKDADKTRRLGESLAMCVGDISFFMANNIIAQSDIPPLIKAKVHRWFNQIFIQTGIGQMDDVYFSQEKNNISLKKIIKMYTSKTSRYTISLPLIVGALLAENKNSINKLDKLGESLGLIFQIHDDLLDLYGSTLVTGKPQGSDIRENKKTIVYLYLIHSASEKDKRVLLSYFGNKNLTPENIRHIHALMDSYHILDNLQKMIDGYKNESIDCIKQLSISQSDKNILYKFIDCLLEKK